MAVIGGVLDVGPKALAKLADAMVAQRAIKADEADLLTRPHIALARHLVQCIVGVAKAQGLAIGLDTCEVLSLELEEYLRDLIICPAVEQTNGLLVIASGRYSQYHAREVEGHDGQRRRVKGYADRLTDPPPTDWNLSQFAEPEIADYLRECGFDPTPDLISYLQQTARGVPFAVQLLVEALHALGPERVRKEFPPDPSDVDLPQLVRLVVARFLSYCLENPTDQSRVRVLALLRERDDAALRAVWQLPEAVSAASILDELQSCYGFIQSDRSLHDVVRSFLRESLRADDHETAHRLGALAVQHYLPLWETETAKFPMLADRIAESRWQRLTLNVLNALCWSDEPAAVRFLAGRALEALEFNWGFARGLVKLAREFRDTEGWWLTRTCRQFDGLVKAVEGSEAEELAGLEALRRDAVELRLDDTARCILHMWRAENLTRQGRAREALEICQEAETNLSADESLRRALAERYASIGGALGFPKGAGIVSQEGKTAYERAVALAPDESGYHCSLGGLLNQIGDLSRGMAHCKRAIELDHRNSVAYNNRGNTYFRLKGYEKALADYTQAIDLNPQYATAYNNRGLSYAELKDCEKALADYSQAIDLDPQDATAYSNRGLIHDKAGNYEQAIADFSAAVERDPKGACYYSHRGLALYRLGRHDEAQRDFDQALSLEVDTNVFGDLAARSVLAGDAAEAIGYLRKAFELDPQDTWDDLEDDKEFDPIRNTPEFEALRKEFER